MNLKNMDNVGGIVICFQNFIDTIQGQFTSFSTANPNGMNDFEKENNQKSSELDVLLK